MPATAQPLVAPPEPQIKDTGPSPQQALAGFFGKLEKTPTDLPGAGSVAASATGGAAPSAPASVEPTANVPTSSAVATATPTNTPKPAIEDANWPRTAADWKALKATQAKDLAEREAMIATLKKEKAEFEAKLKELPKDDPEKPLLKSQIEELKTQVKQFSDQVYSVARERHPDFIAKYDKKIDAAMKLAETVAGPKIVQLMKLPEGDFRDEKMQEVFDGLTEMKRARLGPILNEIDLLRGQRASELNVSQEEFQAMVKKHELDTKLALEQKAREEANLVESMWNGELSKRTTLQAKADDQAFNEALLKRVNSVKDVMMGRAKPDDVIKTMLNAAEYEGYKAESESLREEVRQLKEQLKTVQGANPTLESTSVKSDAKATVQPGMSPKQALAAWIGNTMKAGV